MEIYLPNPKNKKASTLGEEWFFQSPHWKLSVILGYSWRDDVLTKFGFSFFNIRSINASKCERITNFLDNNGIKYSTEYSSGGWQYRIKISKAKKYLEIIDNLYIDFYNKKLKECEGLYIYDNWFIDNETYNRYKEYHDSTWTLKKF